MADALIYRFDGVSMDDYHTVNSKLGLDPASGDGSWPEDLLVHTAGHDEGGSFVLVEVWSSRDAQEAFMERLGPALAAAQIPEPVSVTWVRSRCFASPADRAGRAAAAGRRRT